MNWLAHLYLSDPTPACRIGNLLPDLLPLSGLAALPPEFQQGVARHRRIDAFTDTHPLVKQSIGRFAGPFRRYAGILTDVFYDHFLAKEWAVFSPQPLPEFAAEVYASFTTHRADIPVEAQAALENMRENNWLCSYLTSEGLAAALARIGTRFRRPVELAGAMPAFELHYDALRSDFAAFFPELVSHMAGSAL